MATKLICKDEVMTKEGCKLIFEEKVSGAKADRPELRKMIDTLYKYLSHRGMIFK